jgi:hypothetical protein
MEQVKIIESSQLPLGEKVYLKKDWLGWRVVEPITDPETGKFIWKNFFNKRGFIQLGIILLILVFSYFAFQEQLSNWNTVMSNPCSFCSDCHEQVRTVLGTLPKGTMASINFTT